MASWVAFHMMASICAAGSSAQWVFLNAELAGADKPGMTALAVANGKIVAVGQDRDMRRWIGPGTRVVQAQDRKSTRLNSSHT